MSSLLPLAIVGFVGLVMLVAVFGYLAEKRRREELAAYAASRGWTWTRRDDRWCDSFTDAPFGTGHNRQAHNILQGWYDGRPFVGFDYVFHTTETSTDSQGRSSSREVSHWYSVLGLQIGAQVPNLAVTPEGFFGRAIGRLLNRDIELESEQFNRAFTVTCEDRRFATDVLHPRLMEHLLTAPDVAWRMSNGYLLTVEDGRHSPADIDRRVAVIDSILDSVPEFLRRQYAIPDAVPAPSTRPAPKEQP